MEKIIVIGAGASGLTAAIYAARKGNKVTIIERMDKPGKKILATGNGRCNYINKDIFSDCFRGDDLNWIKEILIQTNPQSVQSFFENIGIYTTYRDGYGYPRSMQAADIVNVLLSECKRLQINILTNIEVKKITKNKNQFVIDTNQNVFFAQKVIVATGGKASSKLGSNGSGFVLAKMMGHHISPVVPALCGLKCQGRYFKQIAGVRTPAAVDLYVENDDHSCVLVARDLGELQLTNYGISGIPVFQISRYAAKALLENKKVVAQIDFFPELQVDEFAEKVKIKINRQPKIEAKELFVGWINQKLISLLLKAAGIDEDLAIEKISKDQLQRLIKVMKSFRMPVIATNSLEEAQVSAGGVKTAEINVKSMESKITKDLYFTGEVIDVDGKCGGYNLYFAWLTGMIAGMNV